MKTIACTLASLCLFFSLPTVAQETASGATIGLAERRIIKSFQEGKFKELTDVGDEDARAKALRATLENGL